MELREERREAIDEMEEFVLQELDIVGTLYAISRALDDDTKKDLFGYIIQAYDLVDDFREWKGARMTQTKTGDSNERA